jgi:hypothetical protein
MLSFLFPKKQLVHAQATGLPLAQMSFQARKDAAKYYLGEKDGTFKNGIAYGYYTRQEAFVYLDELADKLLQSPGSLAKWKGLKIKSLLAKEAAKAPHPAFD